MRFLYAATVLAVLAVLLLASVARAGTLSTVTRSVEGEKGGSYLVDDVRYVAAAGERNDIDASAPVADSVQILDTAGVTPGRGCRALSATGAVCERLGGGALTARLGDGDDRMRTTVEGAIDGGDGDDVIVGSAFADTLDGGPGHDVLSGGSGIDTVTYAGRADGVVITLGRLGLAGTGAEDLLAGDVENAIGGEGPDVLTGDGGPNELTGGRGDDVLRGLGGADQLSAGAGLDDLDGGAGGDFVDGDGPGRDRLAGGPGRDQMRAGPDGGDLDGGAGGDDVLGGTGADALRGGPGPDWLDGYGGDDTLDARDGGYDAVSCSRGRDHALVDALDLTDGCDRIQRTGSPRAVLATLGTVLNLGRPGIISATVGCPQDMDRSCRGRLLARRRGVVVGTGAVTVAPGRRDAVLIPLHGVARALLDRGDRVAMTFVLATRDASGAVHTQRLPYRAVEEDEGEDLAGVAAPGA